MPGADNCVKACGLTGICKKGEPWGSEVYSPWVWLELGFDYINFIDLLYKPKINMK